MKNLSKSLARRLKKSRTLSSCTVTIRQQLVMPSAKVPVVVQSLTLRQIAAIPEDSVRVTVLGLESAIGAPKAVCMASHAFPDSKIGVVVGGQSAIGGKGILSECDVCSARVKFIKGSTGGTGIAVNLKKKTLLSRVNRHKDPLPCARTYKSALNDESYESRLVTILDNLGNLYKEVESLHEDLHHRAIHGGGDDGSLPPCHNIFFPPIDENIMADIILKIKNEYFSCNDVCKINEQKYNLTEFFLLIYIVFGKMRILKNSARKPFCVFLQQKVLMDNHKLTVKTFNNYANHLNFLRLADSLDKRELVLEKAPSKTENPLFLAFHEIARAFHNTEYILSLKSQQRNITQFEL